MLLSLNVVSCQETKETKETKEKTKKTEGAPQAVSTNFKAKYPRENDPDWHIDANGNYEANFKIDGEKYRADYKPDGTWIETENSIKDSELPKAIKEMIEKNYSEFEITEVEKVDHSTKGVFYDVEFKQEGKNRDVEFREEGSIL